MNFPKSSFNSQFVWIPIEIGFFKRMEVKSMTKVIHYFCSLIHIFRRLIPLLCHLFFALQALTPRTLGFFGERVAWKIADIVARSFFSFHPKSVVRDGQKLTLMNIKSAWVCNFSTLVSFQGWKKLKCGRRRQISHTVLVWKSNPNVRRLKGKLFHPNIDLYCGFHWSISEFIYGSAIKSSWHLQRV